MTAPDCATGCGRPAPGAYLCRVCTRELEQALAKLPADMTDLQAVATMQAAGPLGLGLADRYAERRSATDRWHAVHAAADESWVFAPAAADQLWAIGNTLSTWIRHLCESRGLNPPIASRGQWITRRQLIVSRNRWGWRTWREFAPSPDQPLADLATWLVAHIDSIRQDEAAAQIHDEITSLAGDNARYILGRPPADEFFGLCDKPDVRVLDDDGTLTPVVSTCGAQIFGPTDAQRVDCPACGASYSRSERHTAMLAQMVDHLGTVRQAASTLTALGRTVTIGQIDGWIRNGHIATRGSVLELGRQVRLVRIGDVLDRRAAVLERARAKTTKRERMCA